MGSLFSPLFKLSRGLSFRDLREELRDRIEEVPYISNLYYRFKKIDERELEELLESKYIAIDGTGFGYNTKYNQKIKRGKEIRMIKSHIRVGVIIGIGKDIKKNIVTGIKTGGPTRVR